MTRQRPVARLLLAVALAAPLLAATLVAATVMRPAPAVTDAPHYGFITQIHLAGDGGGTTCRSMPPRGGCTSRMAIMST